MEDYRETADYRGHTELAANAALIGFSTLFFGMRIYARALMTKNIGADDAVALVAFVCFLAMVTGLGQENVLMPSAGPPDMPV